MSSRPSVSVDIERSEAWDADMHDILVALLQRPLPLVEYADVGSLPDATTYRNCVATVATNPGTLYVSDGATWRVHAPA